MGSIAEDYFDFLMIIGTSDGLINSAEFKRFKQTYKSTKIIILLVCWLSFGGGVDGNIL